MQGMGNNLVLWVYPRGMWWSHGMQGIDKTLVRAYTGYNKGGSRGGSITALKGSYSLRTPSELATSESERPPASEQDERRI